jgi:hypothetical protein
MLVDVRVILLVEDNTMGKHLHPYTESGTLRAYTCIYTMVTTHQQGDRLSHHQKFDKPFGGSILEKKFFENRCRLV